ncbi:MAG: four helix bundle protein [Chitinophaga sp.]|jgi:four helix bundle protein|nr:four helix bundle protein [Chitinophaga sp.]
MNSNFGFEELEVWKKSRIFKNEIRLLTKYFPPEEKFKLIDQIIRSSRSINSLIAEGHGRFSYPDQIHFCIQARGSLAETINHLIDAFDEAYITNEQLETFKTSGKEIERLLNGYLSYLRKKRDEEKS